MFWLHRRLLYFAFYRRLITWSKTYAMPGFYPIPLYPVVRFFAAEISKDELLNKASSIAYSTLLAIFPGIIFLFTVIPFIPASTGFQKQLLNSIHLLLPDTAFKAFHHTVLDIVSRRNAGLLSLGFFTALLFSTNGVSTLMGAFNKASLTHEKRGWWHKRFVALMLTVVISISILISLGVITLGEFAIVYLKKHSVINEYFKRLGVDILRWVMLILLYMFNVGLLYRFGPDRRVKVKFISPGVILATLLAFITIVFFTLYVNAFNSYNKVYGSIGTLIVVMLWLYFNALTVLIGFELNASIDLSRKTVRLPKRRTNYFKTE